MGRLGPMPECLDTLEGDNMGISKQAAIARLTRRWNEEIRNWPLMAKQIPLSRYIAVNLAIVQRKGLLAMYQNSD